MPIDAANLPPVLPLRVTMRAAEAQLVPAFAGSALHGALGRALWKTVCAFPRRHECAGCPLFNRCAYPALFASCAPAIEGLEQVGIREQAPRPMVLAPEPGWTLPSGHPRLIAQGAEIPFRVTLIGRAIDDLPLLVVALRQMALVGIGRRPHPAADAPRYARAELAGIVSEDGGGTVYDAATELLSTPPPAVLEALNNHDADVGIEIRLVTPLRLKREGKFQGRPSPADFALTLARRANALAALYGGGGRPIDEREVASAAREIQSAAPETRLVHVRRYSARQGRAMEWPGVIGRLRWRGPAVKELWPLLRFGEMVQIGKGATLGFGRYVVASDDDESD